MDERCFIALGVIVLVAVGLFVVVPYVMDEAKPVTISITITHYDSEGNEINVNPEPWWGDLLPGAFSKSGTDISSEWDMSVDYIVSGEAYENLDVQVTLEVEILKQVYSMTQAQWVTEATYTDSYSNHYLTETKTVTQTWDYNNLITNLEEEARYMVTVTGTASATATDVETGEGLSARWTQSVDWQIDWSSDGTLDIEGNLS